MKPITIETAKVFRGGGRRFFTKKAACKAAARAKINDRCECEKDEHWGAGAMDYTPGITCWYHEEKRRTRLVEKLAAIYMRKGCQ